MRKTFKRIVFWVNWIIALWNISAGKKFRDCVFISLRLDINRWISEMTTKVNVGMELRVYGSYCSVTYLDFQWVGFFLLCFCFCLDNDSFLVYQFDNLYGELRNSHLFIHLLKNFRAFSIANHWTRNWWKKRINIYRPHRILGMTGDSRKVQSKSHTWRPWISFAITVFGWLYW